MSPALAMLETAAQGAPWLSFTVPGNPRGKGRPKFARTGKGVRTYTDEKTEAYENLVKFAAVRALGQIKPTSRPVIVSIVIRLVPVRSESLRRRQEMLAGERLPTKKPDQDNVAKAVLDGMNTIVFADDAQVVRSIVSKVYAETPGVDVAVTLVGAP